MIHRFIISVFFSFCEQLKERVNEKETKFLDELDGNQMILIGEDMNEIVAADQLSPIFSWAHNDITSCYNSYAYLRNISLN